MKRFLVRSVRLGAVWAGVVLPSVVCAGARDYSIDAFGAKADGSKCTAAIAAAMSAAEKAGGGRVVVPRGTWYTGRVELKSNCELHVVSGAELLFSDDLSDYLPGVPVSWEGIECKNVSPLVYAYGCTNVAITGGGTLRAKMDFWWTWSGVRKPACEAANRILKNEWSPKGIPVAERELWKLPGAAFRPHFVHFNRCRGVRLEGFSLRASPFWMIHLFLCDGVVARGLDVNAGDTDGRMINNSDGIDIESTRNVLVEGCTFCQGDDGIVLKSGKDADGRRVGTPTENVTIRNCTVRKGHVLVAAGSELSGGIRNVAVENCRVDCSVWMLLRVKTNPRRGGFVENIRMENIEAKEVTADVLGISTRYAYGMPGEEALDREYQTPVRGIVLRNVRVGRARRVLDIEGDYRLPVEDVAVSDLWVAECREPDRVWGVVNLTVDGVARQPNLRPATTEELGKVDLGAAVWNPETKEHFLVLTDGTLAGTVLRRSSDLRRWSEPMRMVESDPENRAKRVTSVKLRREKGDWLLDVGFGDETRTYGTTYFAWPFRPQAGRKE